jgi:Carboxypeptidase regulatory-like domain
VHPPSSPRSFHRVVRALLAAAVLLLCALPAALPAQTPSSATLRGTVRDTAGTVLAGVTVTVIHGPTGSVVSSVTGADGRYQFTGLQPGGPYRVRANRVGYGSAERTGVELRLAQALVLDLRLVEAALVLGEVTVVAQSDPRFSTSNTGAATTVNEEVIRVHPTVERDFVELAQLSPMVSTTRDGGISISGQNERYNSIAINGGLYQDVFGAYASGVPGAEARIKALPLDAIQEFQVQVAPYDVRSSGFTGGFLNAVTRSGTNEWEGSLFGHFRNEALFGDIEVGGATLSPDNYMKQTFGGYVGGPLRRDRLHLFFAAEVETRREPPPGFSLGQGDGWTTRIAADSATRLASLLNDVYGWDAGSAGGYDLENPTGNAFLRLDWRMNEVHRLTTHFNFARGSREVSANRASTGTYEFSSSGYRSESSTLSWMAQLNSRLRDGVQNELTLNVQRTADRQDPTADFAQVEVDIRSNIAGTQLLRRVRAGSSYLVQNSELDQTALQLTNALSFVRSDVTTTLGVSMEAFQFDHTYLPGSRGYYRFADLDSLAANAPSYYEIAGVREGGSASTPFTVVQPAVFLQNEHTFPDGLVLYYGLRADVPLFPDKPGYNERVDDVLDVRTDQLPSGHILLSPRVGFNWQSDLRYTTQVRGGFGVFTGRLPYVWLANAYANTGLRTAVLSCTGEAAPSVTSGPAPTACADGTTLEENGVGTAIAFSPEFRYPRELKTSLAIDQKVPGAFTVTGEVLLVQTIRQVVMRDLNLEDGQASDEAYTDAFGVRRVYGRPAAPFGYTPRRHIPELSHVLQFENEKTSGFAHAVTLGLERAFGSWGTLGGSYSFNSSDDVQSLRAGDPLLNYATAPSDYNPNDPARRPSGFEKPWKTLVYARARLPEWTGGTELSAVYVGEAGSTYSYVYSGDVNGDGYPGFGIPLDFSNDLLYVPEKQSDLPGSVTTQAFIEQLITLDPCLSGIRGQVLRRNECRGPASHRLDLKAVQPVHFGRRRLEVSASLINALNLVNSDWGRVIDIPALVPVLGFLDREERNPLTGQVNPNSRQMVHYVGPVQRDEESGLMRAALPGTVLVPESQWQAQVGLQVFF